ncbi:MAG: metallophosphoesterase, partial [Rhodospirillales bacterium]|nr:metallophosphoesterase [Rhodospirillales bacterium]
APALASVPAQARIAALPFVTIGDWGRAGADEQREVGVQMGRSAAAARSRFVISVGDNFYQDGVASLADWQWQESFERIYDHPALMTPWHVILGNHDYRGNVQAQIDYTGPRHRWRMPARYFARREALPGGGHADFFHIDTSPFLLAYRHSKTRIDGQDTAAQLRWLEAALARSDAAWKIVIGHHPIHTVGTGRRDTRELVERLKPILLRHGVRIYVNGHDHNLQFVETDGLACITCGAGSKTNPPEAPAHGQFAAESHSFMLTRLSVETFDFTLLGRRGETLYRRRVARAG